MPNVTIYIDAFLCINTQYLLLANEAGCGNFVSRKIYLAMEPK